MKAIPTAAGLTAYAGDADDFIQMPFQDLAAQIDAGTLVPRIGKVFAIDDIAEAHRTMEENRAGGKIVVLT